MKFKNSLTALTITAFSVFTTLTTNAQVSKIDSLENVLKNHIKDDTVKVKLLNRIAYSVYKTDKEKAINYLKRSGKLSDSINFVRGKIHRLNIEGHLNSFYTSDTLALNCYLKAIELARGANYEFEIMINLGTAGVKYVTTGNVFKAIECYNEGQKIAEKLNLKQSIATFIANRCVIYTGLGNYEKAIEDYQKALEISEELNFLRTSANIYYNLGCINQFQGNYHNALDYFYKSLENSEAGSYSLGISNAYSSIGEVHLSQNDYPKALEFQFKALKIFKELNYKRKISGCYQAIGEVYMAIGDPKALEYFEKALEIAEKFYYTTEMLNAFIKISDFYHSKNNNKVALEYYGKSLVLAEKVDRRRVICNIWYKIGSIHFSQKEYGKALSNTLNALKIANEMKLLSYQRDIHNQLSEIYAATHNYAKAYTNHKLYKALNDSIYKEENVKRIVELEYTYKFEKEKQAIELEQQKKDALQAVKRKQQNTAILFLGICFILTLVLALFIYRMYRTKHQTNLLLTKQKNEIQELNEEQIAFNEELRQVNEQIFYAKEVIEEREHLLTQITNNIPVYISLLNSKLEYVFTNNGYAEVFGNGKNDLPGRKISDTLNNEYLERANHYISKALEGETVSFENFVLSASNDKQYIQTTYVPYYFHNNIQGVLVCSADITLRKLAEQTLKEVELERKRLLETEIERINRELETNQKSITAATLKLIQNSERDEDTINRLTAIEKNTNAEGKQSINSLISDYKRLSYSSNWAEFEILFEKVHKSFYKRLHELFPDLTANDRKICAFLKLNMSSKDIATITYQSDEALKKARQRLRQKLGIDRETNLMVFLQNI